MCTEIYDHFSLKYTQILLCSLKCDTVKKELIWIDQKCFNVEHSVGALDKSQQCIRPMF